MAKPVWQVRGAQSGQRSRPILWGELTGDVHHFFGPHDAQSYAPITTVFVCAAKAEIIFGGHAQGEGEPSTTPTFDGAVGGRRCVIAGDTYHEPKLRRGAEHPKGKRAIHSLELQHSQASAKEGGQAT